MASQMRAGSWVIVAAVIGSSMGFIDGTAVNVALPLVQRSLDASAGAMQWIVEGYALLLSSLILVGGALGDRFGRRAVFVIGIVIFALSSAACALAANAPVLIAARCVQGIGAALFIPGSLALISANFDGAARGRAIGTWSGFSAITTAFGPMLGGWLAQTYSWRAVFLINLPLALVVVAVALLRVPESRDDESPQAIDLGGAVFVTAGLAALVYALIDLQSGANRTIDVVLGACGVALLGGFVAYERRVKDPMLKADLFASRPFVGANLYTLLLYAALGGSLYFLPFDLINVQNYTPLAAGMSLLPFVLIMSVASRWSGGLVARTGARLPLTAGAVLAAAAFAGFSFIGIGAGYWSGVFPYAVVLGCAGALFVAPLTTTVMSAAAAFDSGIASGINNAASRVAGLLAVAGLGFVLALAFNARLDENVARLGLAPPAVAQLERQRDDVLSGHVDTTHFAAADRDRVRAAIAQAYAAGFAYEMRAAALLSLLAAGLALAWPWNSVAKIE